jgi:hypothetical protein
MAPFTINSIRGIDTLAIRQKPKQRLIPMSAIKLRAGNSPPTTSGAFYRRLIAAPKPGQVGGLLRHEGLYSSHIAKWRARREAGLLKLPVTNNCRSAIAR